MLGLPRFDLEPFVLCVPFGGGHVRSVACRWFALTLRCCCICQDEEHGGISDRPEDMVDVYHTFFGVAGLSLLGKMDLPSIDPTFALPVETVERLRRSHDAGSRNG